MSRTFPTRVFFVASILMAVAGAAFAQTDLIISEYIEGTSFNKAIELKNPTASPINMTTVDYRLSLYTNGAAAPSQTLNLTATIPAGGTWVISHASANATILAAANQTSSAVINFNGDDALVLTKGGLVTVVDSFGQVGVDPGTNWGSGATSSLDRTLRRKPTVCSGDVVTNNAFDPVTEFDGFATDDASGLGAHTVSCAPPPPTLNIADFAAPETNAGTTTFTFQVSITGTAAAPVTFDVATADGAVNPANAGSDYVAAPASGPSGSVPAGTNTSTTVTITVNGDVTNEANETFFVNITNVVGATNPDGQGLGTINNDDGAPTLNVSDFSAVEGAAGTQIFTFNVTTSAPAGPGGVTFDVGTQDNSATDADNDYEIAGLTGQTISAGSTGPVTLNVTVNGDNNPEPTEQFFVNISNITGAGAVPGDVQGVGTITTDDALPNLTITDVTQAETSAGTTTFTFNVNLSAPAPPGGVTFDIATADGTAQDDNPAVSEDNDYVAQSLTGQTIATGVGPYPFAVTVNGDAVFEPNETFFVNVTNVTGAIVTDGQGQGTINNDDTAPTLSIADAVITEGAAGTLLLTFTVTLAPATPNTVTVDYATANGSATVADNDYVAISTTQLTFNPNETSKTFDVTINGDTNAEGNEDFLVNLTNVNANAVIGDGQALGIIRMDDPRGIPAVDTPVLENFDSLATTPPATVTTAATTPVGWTLLESPATNFTYFADDGGSTTGNTYSFGTDASTDRAFGGLQSGAVTPTIGAFYRNDTGVTVTRLTINYIGEEWRLGTASRTDQLDFQYSLDATSLSTGTWVDVDGLDFVTPNTATTGAKDGNNVANRTPRSATITGLNIPNGQTFWIRYNDFNASGGDDGLAVDDFSIVANISGLLTINDVSILEGNAGTQILSFTVTRSDASGTPTTFDITTQDNTATDADNDYEINSVPGATIPGDNTTTTYTFNVTINGDVTSELTETFFVNISNVTNATLGDAQGIGSIMADDFTFTAINAVQGSGNTSPMNGATVTVNGIVTGIKQGGSGGFFVQTDDASVDADPNTSEGIFVFTAGVTPAGVAIGNRVAVTGTVAEFPASAAPHTTTELTTASASLLASAQTLPAAITLTMADGAASTNLSQYERFEGMRVAATIDVTNPTAGSVNESAATGSSNGVFYGVIAGVTRPLREPGIPVNDTVPAEAPSPGTIPRFDRNPERLRVSSTSQPGATQVNVVVGQTVSNLVGPLDYGFFEYSILPEAATVPVVSGPSTASPIPLPLATELTVSSFNMFHFYDTIDDPESESVTPTLAVYNNRLSKASLAVRNILRNPDVLGVVEAEKLVVLQDMAAKINTDNAGSTNYTAYLIEGNDIGGIDVGYLVNANRVNVIAVTQEGDSATFTNPNTMAQETLHDRPPLLLRASIQRPDATTYNFSVLNTHLRSLIDAELDDASGRRARAKRAAGAEWVANFIQSRQTLDPTERIVVVGDFNAFEFNDGFVDVIGTIKGTPAPANQVVLATSDLVNPNMTNLVETIAAADRYSFVFSGNLQVLDHAIVTAAFMPTFTRASFGHLDAGFPEIFRGDFGRPERLSDHDAIVAYFDISPVGALAFSAANYDVSESTTTFNVTVNRTGGTAGTVSATYTVAAGTAQPADFTAATGTVTFLNGETSKTFPVTIVNDAIDEANQTIALSLSAPTGGATLGAQSTATITILDDDAPPVFTISDATPIAEGDSGSTNAQLTVTLTGATEFTPSVNWATAPDSATAGSDYTTSGTTLNFSAGAGPQTQTINVPILGDTTDEPNERLFVDLSGATNASIGDAQGEITITDDDAQPVFTISDVSVAEGNAGSANATLTVTLTGATQFATSVNWSTAPDSATAGSDYTTSGATLNFPAGAGPQSQTIDIPILGDTTDEPNERLFVNLTVPTNATIGDAQGEIGIVDDDGEPQLMISDLAVAEGNSGTVNYNLVVTLVGSTSQTVTVDYQLTGTASCCGVDFSGPLSAQLSFPPGTTTRNIGITVFGDTTYETNETVLANLSNATNATIADNQGILTINNDDAAPTLIISDVSLAEGNSGTTNFVFTVTLTGPTELPASVNFATANGTATAGSDYTSNSGTLTFNPGTTTQPITVLVNGDTGPETNETFFVNLTNATNATINDNQGLGTITDDDSVNTADLVLTQTITPPAPRAGQFITLTLTVTNNGPGTATNVVLTDNTPPGLTISSVTPSQGSCSGNPIVVCSLGTILNGANATVTIVFNPPANAGTFINTASVVSDQTDPSPVVNNTQPIVVVGAAESDVKIPTLSEWALIAMALMLAAFAAMRLRT